jgi:hypothetical protein
MKRIVKTALAVVFIVAVSAAPAAAGSYVFKAAQYPVRQHAVATNLHGFEVTGAVSICKKAEFNTAEEGAPNPTKPQETLIVHPVYTECEISLAGTFKAKVVTTGCNYKFHAVAPGSKTGPVDIVCEAGKQIEVITEGLSGCVITVGSQNGVKNVEYVNSAGKVSVNAEASGIKYKAASACGIALSGENALYREGEFVAGVAKLAAAGHPAKALSEGFNELSEPDAVEVATSPHWYKSGALLTSGLSTPVFTAGTSTDLKLVSGIGEIHCKTVGGGVIENTAGGGFGKTQAESFYGCVAPTCESEVKAKFGVPGRGEIKAENLPEAGETNSEGWESSLFETGSPLTSRITTGQEWTAFPSGGQKGHESPPGMERLDVICSAPSTHTHVSEAIFEGQLEPEIGEAVENLNGTSAAHPSTMKFGGSASGSLHSEAGGTGAVTGSVRYLGYTSLEVMSVGK